MNDLDLCLEVESRSCQPLRYIQCSLSRKPLEMEAWFQRTTNSKRHTGYQMARHGWRHVTLKSQTRDPNTLKAQCLENGWSRDSVLKDQQSEMAYGVSNVVWGSTVGYPCDSLASCFIIFLLLLMRHYAVNWCDKLRFMHLYLLFYRRFQL